MIIEIPASACRGDLNVYRIMRDPRTNTPTSIITLHTTHLAGAAYRQAHVKTTSSWLDENTLSPADEGEEALPQHISSQNSVTNNRKSITRV